MYSLRFGSLLILVAAALSLVGCTTNDRHIGRAAYQRLLDRALEPVANPPFTLPNLVANMTHERESVEPTAESYTRYAEIILRAARDIEHARAPTDVEVSSDRLAAAMFELGFRFRTLASALRSDRSAALVEARRVARAGQEVNAAAEAIATRGYRIPRALID